MTPETFVGGLDGREVEAYRTLVLLNQMGDRLSYGFSSAKFGNMSKKWGGEKPEEIEIVLANREKYAELAGISTKDLVFMSPVGGKEVLVVSRKDAGLDNLPGADAIITLEKDLGLVLTPADCTPIIITNKNNEFVAMVHAGRTGTDLQICVATVEKLMEMGFDPVDFVVGIGPADECDKEYLLVNNPDMWMDFVSVPEDSGAEILVGEDPSKKTKFRIEPSKKGVMLSVEMVGCSIAQLIGMGVPPENIVASHICTVCNAPERRTYSHNYSSKNEDLYPISRFMAYVQLKS